MIALYLAVGGFIFLYGYWLVGERARRVWLAVGNIAFLLAFGWKVLLLHLATCFINYVAACFVNGPLRAIILTATVTANVAFIAYFKILNIADVRYIIPLGISYYTLIHLGYVLDLAKAQAPRLRGFFEFYLYAGFFPCILMGPIERASFLWPQLEKKPQWNWDRVSEGASLIALGLFKKLVIADRLHDLAYPLNHEINRFSGLGLWIYFLLCWIQLYCDFSSYIDIVRGFAKWMGLDLSENFRQPYLARSVPEIWQRWNITLVSWLRNHLYLPVIMRTKSMYFATLVVMVVIGLWHMFQLTFLMWALYWTLLYWIHIFLRTRGITLLRNRLLSSLLMVTAMSFSTLFLQSYSWEQLSGGFIRAITPTFGISALLASQPFAKWDFTVVALASVLIIAAETIYERFLRGRELRLSHRWVAAGAALILFFLSLLFGVSNSYTFVYLRF